MESGAPENTHWPDRRVVGRAGDLWPLGRRWVFRQQRRADDARPLWFSRCLLANAGDPDAKEWEVCIALGDKRRAWLRGNLVPKVLMVRNAVQPVKPNQALCEKVARRVEPAQGEVRPSSSGHCTGMSENAYVPEMPVCKESSRAFIEFTGPLFAIKNVSGIGAHGKLSEARQANAVRALRTSMGKIPRESRSRPSR